MTKEHSIIEVTWALFKARNHLAEAHNTLKVTRAKHSGYFMDTVSDNKVHSFYWYNIHYNHNERPPFYRNLGNIAVAVNKIYYQFVVAKGTMHLRNTEMCCNNIFIS